MQLDLTLRSDKKKRRERKVKQTVIYKTTSTRFEEAYKQVAKEHPKAEFIKENDFKEDLIKIISGSKYIYFLVDDCIFTREYSVNTICKYLDIYEGTIGFSLRLGKNTTYCYSLDVENEIPEMQYLGNDIYASNWREIKRGDFGYPLEVSSSIYRAEDLKPLLKGLFYFSPNSLEWGLYLHSNKLSYRPFLMYYETSVAFCNPINRVQSENTNRTGTNEKYGIDNLLELYSSGYRIDYSPFDKFVSTGAHQEEDIRFVHEHQGRNKRFDREVRRGL
jgi:hypothetical protein